MTQAEEKENLRKLLEKIFHNIEIAYNGGWPLILSCSLYNGVKPLNFVAEFTKNESDHKQILEIFKKSNECFELSSREINNLSKKIIKFTSLEKKDDGNIIINYE